MVSQREREMMLGKRILIVCIFGTILISCSPKELRVESTQVSPEINNPQATPEESYVVGPGDTLQVVVWKEPSLSGLVTVRPDGFVTLPLVNEVQVTGLKTATLRETLEKRFREFVTDAYVTVRVEKIASSEVFLIGEVAKAGAYPLIGNDTFLQILTRAGGLSPFADRHNIRVVRRQGDKVTEFIVDYDAILKGDVKQDILLRQGDRIIVP
jgi:polysaccharide export outer membrane protein